MRRLAISYKKNLEDYFFKFRQVCIMMSKDWNVLLIVLMLLIIICWKFAI